MKEDRRERLPPSKQNCRGERGALKKKLPATRAVRGQMTSCIAASLLSRSAVPRWGGGGWRGWRGSFPLSVCTFFSIRWIQSRAHGLGSVFGPRDVLLLLPFLSFSQLEWTRAVHVTSHLERGAGPGFNRSLNFRLNYL